MILVTGITGLVGRRVAELLVERGAEIRGFTRHPERVSISDVEIVRGDYADLHSLHVALAGVSEAFVVSAEGRPGERALLHKNVFDAAAHADVSHLVYLSFQGASPDSAFPMSVDHCLSERYLKASGVPFTALRDNIYMDLLPTMFDAEGVLRGPAGDGRVAWVSREDVSQVATAALMRPETSRGTFDVTGPEALTIGETVERLARLVGRPLRYVKERVEEGRLWRRRLAPDGEVDVWIGSYLAIARGELEPTSHTVFQFTGRHPRTLEQYFDERPELLEPLRAPCPEELGAEEVPSPS